MACQAWKIAMDVGNEKAQAYLNDHCN